MAVVWRKTPEEVRASSLQTGRWCPRPPAGTRSHGIRLWQLKKCRLEIRRGFSRYGVSAAPVVWFELGLKSPSLEGTGCTQLLGCTRWDQAGWDMVRRTSFFIFNRFWVSPWLLGLWKAIHLQPQSWKRQIRASDLLLLPLENVF